VRPTLLSTWRALLAVALVIAGDALAQAEVAGNPPPTVSGSTSKAVGEYWQARLRYGLAYRSGRQEDPGPGLIYSGITYNDLAFEGWAWFGYVGAHLGFQREAFGLFANNNPTAVTAGGLIRANVELAGRLPLGPFRPELYAGYAFQQLPTFNSSLSPDFAAATRHAANLGLRLLLDIGPVTVEARGQVPLPLATSGSSVNGMVASAGSNGYSVGGGVRVQIANADKLHIGALVDAHYVADNVVLNDMGGNDLAFAPQGIVRAGVSLDVQWKDVILSPKLGGVVVKVIDMDTGAPLPGADVTLTTSGQERPMTPDAAGALALRGLPPGNFTLRTSAPGYLPLETAGAITAGVDTSVQVPLKKEPPKVGSIAVTVTEFESKKPLPGVQVSAGDKTATTDDSGVAKLADLQPGPVALALSLEGFQKGEEAASVTAGKTTDVAITLVPNKKRVPATITGIVRSTKGGAPIAADLEIPQVKLKTKASKEGAFTFRVEGGTYTVKISAPGYMTQTKDVAVKDGDQAIFNVDLYPK
jgi:hypothetical protein